jgi:hypothetical protein
MPPLQNLCTHYAKSHEGNDRTRANRDHQLAAIVDLYLVRYY